MLRLNEYFDVLQNAIAILLPVCNQFRVSGDNAILAPSAARFCNGPTLAAFQRTSSRMARPIATVYSVPFSST
jgi:hypothetical protein